MVFLLIHSFLGCCFNFPNISFQALLLHVLSSPIVDLYVLALSLYSSNFALYYYYSFLFPLLSLVC